jgi:putative two-component system hydrogenase maturation factor HypX/HoxX
MSLSGSELRSLVLPLRAGEDAAKRLLTDCLPTSPTAALALGLVDEIGPGDPHHFHQWVLDRATAVASAPRVPPPAIDTAPIRARELADMHLDIFRDRYGFRARRRAFLGLPAW